MELSLRAHLYLPGILLACLFYSLTCSAEALLEITPLSLSLNKSRPIQYISLTNNSTGTINLQISANSWHQLDNYNEETPSSQLVALPPVLIIPPNKSRVVRFTYIGDWSFTDEQAFRIHIHQLNSSLLNEQDNTQINLVINLSFPIFLEPIETIAAKPRGSACLIDNSKMSLTLFNAGSNHCKMVHFSLLDHQGKSLTSSAMNQYLLSKTQMKIEEKLQDTALDINEVSMVKLSLDNGETLTVPIDCNY